MQAPPRSLWWDTLPTPVEPRPALAGHLDVDVAIVGGGFTGLWTARELLERDPALRVVVLEKSVCGFGASGRNGGWASALYPVSDEIVVKRYGSDAHAHLNATLRRAVSDIGETAARDGIDAHFAHGGSLVFARSEVQAQRLRAHIENSRFFGMSEQDLVWLEADEARERGGLSNVFGATYTPHCGAIHPARLVRGLVGSVLQRGAQIFEGTAVTHIDAATSKSQAQVVTVGGSVHARYVVRATEGFTPTLPGMRREFAPVYSLMIATEPLSDDFWNDRGFAQRETFADDRHLIIYGQRTADGRIAFGGRGAPYHFGSTVEPRFDESERVFDVLESTLRELFPAWNGPVTHRWGGPLAMPRDLSPSVRIDHVTGLASAGGYTGDGVVLTRVAAQALADLITAPGTETEFTRLPFVQRRSKNWEVEPLRWAGINVGLALATYADWVERTKGVQSRASATLDRLFDQFPP